MAKTKREKTLMRARRRKRGSKRDIEARQEQVQGVIHNAPLQTIEEVREVVRAARARHMATQASEMMDEPMLGDEAGRAIFIGSADEHEATRLYDTFKAIDASDDAFSRRVLNRSRFANVSKLELMPERLETRPDDRIDIRTEDEKSADAKRAWLWWCAMFDALHPPLHAALHMGLRQRVKLHQGQALTLAGRLFVQALRQVDTTYRSGLDARRKVR